MNTTNVSFEYLSKKDRVMKGLISRYAVRELKPHTKLFEALCSSVISQQLSTKAARTIEARFHKLFSGGLSPEAVLERPTEELRTCGISASKAGYIRNVAEHAVKGHLNFRKLNKLTDEEIIAELVKIKGIGQWTAEMILMFSFARPDVFSLGDQGLKTAIIKNYKLKTPVEKQTYLHLSKKWQPYSTTACLLLWASLENTKEKK